jgi:uncharacterized protein YraI
MALYWRGVKLKSTFLRALAVFVGICALPANEAAAQNQADFVKAFAGEWQIYDDSFASDAQNCRLKLLAEAEADRYKLEARSCSGELANVARWGIADGQMILLAGAEPVATLGGSQHRMSGTSKAGKPLVLERVTAAAIVTPLHSALQVSGCYYLGFTDRCSAESELAKPPAQDGTARINVLVNLNARAEARDDANIIGVVPANSCVVADACVTASDGVWCRAQFGDRTGWLRKLVLRQNRWPVVTFANQCQE